MNQKIILITGATDGIGKQTAHDLAKTGARIIIHGRSGSRLSKTQDEIIKLSGNSNIDIIESDFSSLESVAKMAGIIKSQYSRLDVLINNAGVYLQSKEISNDGFEMTFAVNHLAHFLLTIELLDLIKKSSPARIIHVSSGVHQSGKIDFDNFHGEKKYDAYGAYAMSKIANLLFSNKLSEILSGSGVTSNALHPGVIATKLLNVGFGMAGGASVENGAATSVFLATSSAIEKITGKYFVNSREAAPSTYSADKTIQQKLWDVSMKLIYSFLKKG